MIMETLITKGIKVSVETTYQSDYSRPSEGKYIHAYRITIENISSTTVQLMTRHWRVKDADGTSREIEGDGVVGQQPVISPGENYRYVSWCHLRTEIGRMWGTYHMMDTITGEDMEVHIPEFLLTPAFKLN